MAALELKEALAIIDTGKWVSIRCITADVKKGTGGSVLEIPKARLNMKYSKESKKNTMPADYKSRQPRHHLHFTRNMELPNKLIRKIHPILITHLNDVAVL